MRIDIHPYKYPERLPIDIYTLTFETTGRKLDIGNHGVVGIDKELVAFKLNEVILPCLAYNEKAFLPVERKEFAEYMIDLWTRFGTSITG